MSLIIGNPSKYVQGAGTTRVIGYYTSKIELRDRALMIGGRTALSKTHVAITESFKSQGITHVAELFEGEVTRKEIDRLAEIGKKTPVNFVAGGRKIN